MTLATHDSLLRLRLARREDAVQIARFYAPYALETAVNFEYEAPDAEEFARRIDRVQQRFPFIVAELVHADADDDDADAHRVVGYAFAVAMGDRPAWDWAIDTSIYLDREVRGHHIGSTLYRALEEILVRQNVVESLSCITVSEQDDLRDLNDLNDQALRERTWSKVQDPHLPMTSPRFHAANGYTVVGREPGVGFKFNTWYDKLWMQKRLQPRPARPLPVVPLPQLPQNIVDEVLNRYSTTIAA